MIILQLAGLGSFYKMNMDYIFSVTKNENYFDYINAGNFSSVIETNETVYAEEPTAKKIERYGLEENYIHKSIKMDDNTSLDIECSIIKSNITFYNYLRYKGLLLNYSQLNKNENCVFINDNEQKMILMFGKSGCVLMQITGDITQVNFQELENYCILIAEGN